jgi:hypothetical protein
MPPKRKASDPLSGTTICLSGTLSKGRKVSILLSGSCERLRVPHQECLYAYLARRAKQDIEADIKAAGGKVAGSITKTCTHLVTTTAEFLGPTAKVKWRLGRDR